MTQIQNTLATLLLTEHFGDIVGKVGRYLVGNGPTMLRDLIRETKETSFSVKKSLGVLIKHNFVTFDLNPRNFVLYRIDIDLVLSIIRYPQYIEIGKNLFKSEGEFIIREILLEGQTTLQNICENVSKKYPNATTSSSIKEKFKHLVEEKFIERCATLVEDKDDDSIIPKFELQDGYRFVVPSDIYWENNDDERPSKRMRTDIVKNEINIYWKLNCDRFHLYLRDELIIKSISTRLGEIPAAIVKIFLKIMADKPNPWSMASVPISKLDVDRHLPKDYALDKRALDQYLTFLTEDSSGILLKLGNEQGGVYALQVQKIILSIAWCMVEKIVEERFSSKHCRIFRLLKMKQYLEQKEIETFAMIPPKEAKDITYQLFKDNFIHIQDVPQTPDYAPARTFYLFCIKFSKVMAMLLEWGLKSCSNLKLRRNYEGSQNKRLLEKQQKINDIVMSLKSQNVDPEQIAEVEEMITPPEHTQLQKVHASFDRLELGETQLLDSILIFHICVRYFST